MDWCCGPQFQLLESWTFRWSGTRKWVLFFFICSMSNHPLTLRNISSSLCIKRYLHTEQNKILLFEHQRDRIVYMWQRIAFEEKVFRRSGMLYFYELKSYSSIQEGRRREEQNLRKDRANKFLKGQWHNQIPIGRESHEPALRHGAVYCLHLCSPIGRQKTSVHIGQQGIGTKSTPGQLFLLLSWYWFRSGHCSPF